MTKLLPRFIRLRDAPDYLGVDRNRFNAEIRPSLTEIPIGVQGVAFDRLDLDDWADHYKDRNGRPKPKGMESWGKDEPPASEKPVMFGISKRKSQAMALFEKAHTRATSRKPTNI